MLSVSTANIGGKPACSTRITFSATLSKLGTMRILPLRGPSSEVSFTETVTVPSPSSTEIHSFASPSTSLCQVSPVPSVTTFTTCGSASVPAKSSLSGFTERLYFSSEAS